MLVDISKILLFTQVVVRIFIYNEIHGIKFEKNASLVLLVFGPHCISWKMIILLISHHYLDSIRRIWPFLFTEVTSGVCCPFEPGLLRLIPYRTAPGHLQLIQNVAARLVFNIPKISRTTPLLRPLLRSRFL